MFDLAHHFVHPQKLENEVNPVLDTRHPVDVIASKNAPVRHATDGVHSSQDAGCHVEPQLPGEPVTVEGILPKRFLSGQTLKFLAPSPVLPKTPATYDKSITHGLLTCTCTTCQLLITQSDVAIASE